MLSTTSSPSPFQIRQARKKADLGQAEAAAIVHLEQRAWRRYEKDEAAMNPAVWEYFLLQTGQHPDFWLSPRS